jgi:hypothetical protein
VAFRYHRSVKDTLFKYQFANTAQIVAFENYLKIGPTSMAVTALDGFIGFQAATVEAFGCTKACKDLNHTYLAAQVINNSFMAVFKHLKEHSWPKELSAETLQTNTGASTVDTRSWVGKWSTSMPRWRTIFVIAALVILIGLIQPLCDRLSHWSAEYGCVHK